MFNKIEIAENEIIINFGCGRYPELIEDKFSDNSVISYDPLYDGVNSFVLTTEQELYHTASYLGGNGVVMCANVLNVLTDDLLALVIGQLKTLCKSGAVVNVGIYEGDKSGNGNPTKKGYQRNERAKEYIKHFAGFNVVRKSNILIIK